ncbi:hypothetical protein, partial [Phocaeicola barnesiae]
GRTSNIEPIDWQLADIHFFVLFSDERAKDEWRCLLPACLFCYYLFRTLVLHILLSGCVISYIRSFKKYVVCPRVLEVFDKWLHLFMDKSG